MLAGICIDCNVVVVVFASGFFSGFLVGCIVTL